jgi:hypothetical protein
VSSPSSPSSRASAARELDEIQQVLAAAVAAAEERERALAAPPADESAHDHEPVLARLFEQLEGRLRAFHECTERADRDAGEAYTALSERADALSRWLALATESRQKLADWAGRAV